MLVTLKLASFLGIWRNFFRINEMKVFQTEELAAITVLAFGCALFNVY